MAIRKGVDQIDKRNKEVSRRLGQSGVPELVLTQDGDLATMRILTDEPLDIDFHEIYEPGVSKRPFYPYCTLEDAGECEYCKEEVKKVRMFMFWVHVAQILHNNQDQEGSYQKVTVGGKTYYQEDVNAIFLLKRKFGRGGELWNQFKEAYENFGTWKDRIYRFRRRGEPKSTETTYTLTAIDKAPMPEEISKLMGKLPSLEDVAKGVVTQLPFSQEKPQEVKKKGPVATPTMGSKKPKVEVAIPEEDPDVEPSENGKDGTS